MKEYVIYIKEINHYKARVEAVDEGAAIALAFDDMMGNPMQQVDDLIEVEQ